jgi:dipeptidyl aminopeptidase/acylaminoacyl peptidase
MAMKRGLKFNAVIVVGSVPDLELDLKRMEGLYSELIPNYSVYPKTELMNRSANAWVEKINSPLLIVHGKKDNRAPVEGAIELAKRLKALNKPYKMVLYPDSGHNLSEHRPELKKEVYEWFKDHLK